MTRPLALLLDLDGTLYNQKALRLRIMRDFALSALKSPLAALRHQRIITAYRHAQEHMRTATGDDALASRQLDIAAASCGHPKPIVEASIKHWFETAPLRHLPACAYPGLVELLDFCRASGIRLAICSDYPALRKLEALAIANYFDAVIAAQDADVGRFKPSPRILEVALERLGVRPADALYAGDRPEVDGEAAAAAGISYVNVVQAPGSSGLTLPQLLASLKGE